MTDTRRVTFQDVAFDVPTAWHEGPSDEGLDYVAPDESEQLIVSVSPFKAAMDPDDVSKAISAAVAARQGSVFKISQGQGQLLPVQHEDGAVKAVMLVGADVSNGVLMCVRIIGSATKLATAGYYRYGDTRDVTGFMEVAGPVCRSVQFVTQ